MQILTKKSHSSFAHKYFTRNKMFERNKLFFYLFINHDKIEKKWILDLHECLALSMETSVEETINPFIHLRREIVSQNSMREGTHIGTNERCSCMHFCTCVFVWELHYSKLLYRLTDSLSSIDYGKKNIMQHEIASCEICTWEYKTYTRTLLTCIHINGSIGVRIIIRFSRRHDNL